ncbi:vasoactive intestinal polypeptide receptor 1-like [Babylonia areolata]|uniref:vasoactive intestinal polypeptide receptor 1-like n=1 Tax=Babylonia areolata TaxID=304850 RepID=UPI003FD61930
MDKQLECQIRILTNPPLSLNHSHCSPVWDTLMCWPETRAGTVAVQPCPDYIDKFRLDQNATRTCLENGSWYVHPGINAPWTNFTKCMLNNTVPPVSHLIRSHMGWIHLMYNVNYGLSLGSLVLAVLIMLSFKRLHCPRNTVHLNLFVTFILRASVSFLKDNLLVKGIGFPSDVIQTPSGAVTFRPNRTHWECKLFFTTFHYVLGANYMWIFVEALYLHCLITVAVFSERTGLKYYIVFGWTMPLSFVIPWAIVRATNENVLCWNTHPTEEYFWIMKGPIVASLAMSFVLFLSIIRVLYIKLSAVYSPEARKFRKLAKSTLVLIPLFGVHYIVFLFLPNNVDERTELVKLYFEMFFNSIQGFFVALLFCFFNGEVQGEIRKAWTRFRLTHHHNDLDCWLGCYCPCPCLPCPCRSDRHPQPHLHHHHHSYYTTDMTRARDTLGSQHSPVPDPLAGTLTPVAARGDKLSSSSGTRLLVMETTPLQPLSRAALERQVLSNGKGSYGRGGESPEPEPISCHRSSSNGDCGPSLIGDEYRVS